MSKVTALAEACDVTYLSEQPSHQKHTYDALKCHQLVEQSHQHLCEPVYVRVRVHARVCMQPVSPDGGPQKTGYPPTPQGHACRSLLSTRTRDSLLPSTPVSPSLLDKG